MATIIVEDGSIVANANSYVSEAELTTYATDRGVTLTTSADVLIIQAMDYIEVQSYKGARVSSTQELSWPRSGVYVDGVLIASNEIPKDLKLAQMATCLSINAGFNPLAVVDRATKREKLDVMEIEYQENANDSAYMPGINRYLNKLLVAGSGSGMVAMTRVY